MWRTINQGGRDRARIKMFKKKQKQSLSSRNPKTKDKETGETMAIEE